MPASGSESAYDPVLRWLIFTGVSVFAAVALWRYGLTRLMLASDRTHISSVIAALYLVASLHACACAVAISRVAAATEALHARRRLPPGLVGDYIGELKTKAAARGAGPLDQTLLLRALSQRLRAGHALGALASDALMKLGLVGTIVGFVLMLAPVAGLDATDDAAVQTAMARMSEGMAVAMYTTLAGLVGSILVRAQYFLLESATRSAFWNIVRLTETRLVPALERGDV